MKLSSAYGGASYGVWDGQGVFIWRFVLRGLGWLQLSNKWFLDTLQIETKMPKMTKIGLLWARMAENRPEMAQIGKI